MFVQEQLCIAFFIEFGFGNLNPSLNPHPGLNLYPKFLQSTVLDKGVNTVIY